jgi:LmeA-like phospholipid-binding
VIKRVLFGLICLIVLAVAADLVATSLVDHHLASRAKSQTGATAASVSLGSFPVLYHVLAQGEVPSVDVDLSGVPVGPLRIHEVRLALADVRVSRHRLIADRRIDVTSVERAAVTADVTSADLSAAVGRPVRVTGNGQVQVDVAGVEATVTPRLEGNRELVIEVDGFSLLDVDLARVPVLSACSFTLRPSPGQLALTCTVDPVPPAVVSILSGSAG